MDAVYDGAIRIVALFSSVCLLKLLLPGGNMKRSAIKAVDIVVLLSVIRIISGALANG